MAPALLTLLDSSEPADGLRLPVSTTLDDIRDAARDATAVVLEFTAFRDGRGFSIASALRADGFEGRLTATGDVLPDQARHLARSGFDAVELPPGSDPANWTRMLDAFHAPMQAAERGDAPTWSRRRPAPRPSPDRPSLDQIAALLNDRHAESDPATLIRAALDPAWGLKPAVLSSFGAEAAVILEIVSRVDRDLPVLFLDTGQHFLQTLSYRRQLTDRLALTDVRIVTPDPAERQARDARDDLWRTDTDACCDLRKVRPLARASAGFDLLITGRKRHHRGDRAALPLAEVTDGTLRLNPLAAWTAADVAAHFDKHDLPAHPLVEQGYPSIGCWPCTRPAEDDDIRSGRWADSDKRECGIHLSRANRAA